MQIYFLSGLIGLALQLAVAYFFLGRTDFSIIGASACALGLVLAFAAIMPHESVTTMLYFIIPVNITMRHLGMIIVALNATLGVTGLLWRDAPWAGYACFAHLGGAMAGWYYVRLLGYGGQPMTYEQLWKQQPAPCARARSAAKWPGAAGRVATPEIDAGGRAPPSAAARPGFPGGGGDRPDPGQDQHLWHRQASRMKERRQLEAASREIAGRDKPPTAGL